MNSRIRRCPVWIIDSVVRFEVLTAVTVKSAVFWDVTSFFDSVVRWTVCGGGLDVLTEVIMKFMVLWVVTPCGWERARRFGGTCPILQDRKQPIKKPAEVVWNLRSLVSYLGHYCIPKMDALYSSETLGSLELYGVTAQKTSLLKLFDSATPSKLIHKFIPPPHAQSPPVKEKRSSVHYRRSVTGSILTWEPNLSIQWAVKYFSTVRENAVLHTVPCPYQTLVTAGT
jgi:hypothetical protein